jgi:hypothetical protein
LQSNTREAIELIINVENANTRLAGGKRRRSINPIFTDKPANGSIRYYLTHHPNAAAYRKSVRENKLKFFPYRSGIKTLRVKPDEQLGDDTIIGMLQNLQKNKGISQGWYRWFVIGRPSTIAEIDSITEKMPERILDRKKLSYASLILVLKI